MMKKDYYFIYKTTNLVNGKYYIGVHHSRTLEDEYLGSGKELRRAVLKYGKENFRREILELCESEEKAYLAEARWVTLDQVLDPMCYNVKLGGKGGSKGLVNMHIGESNIRIRKEDVSLYESQGYVRGRSENTVEKRRNLKYVYRDGITTCVPKEQLKDYLENGWEEGRAYLKSRIQVWKGGKRRYIHPKDLQNFLDQGWTKNMPSSWTSRISQYRKGKSTTKGKVRVTNGEEDKIVEKDQVDRFLQEGWKLGGKPKNTGFRWMSKGSESLRVFPQDFVKFEENGYVYGRLNYRRK